MKRLTVYVILAMARITSYNVCYTKLLRLSNEKLTSGWICRRFSVLFKDRCLRRGESCSFASLVAVFSRKEIVVICYLAEIKVEFMLRQKCLGAFFGVVLSFVSVYADNLVVNGNFSETSHSKEWGTTLPGKELPRVLNSWALVSADDVNFANSPCATESEGLQDGVWYKIGSQRGYERACYHTLNENSVLGLCVSKRTLQYGVAVFQNIGTPLNTTKKYTLKFKAGFYGEFNVGTGTAISNVIV